MSFSHASPRTKEKLAVTLMTTFLFGWIVITLVIQAFQIHQQGYGSGFDDGHRLPDQVRYQFHHDGPTTPDDLMNETSR
jgi:hypothetical protein